MGFQCTEHGDQGRFATFCTPCEEPPRHDLDFILEQRALGASVKTTLELPQFDGSDKEDIAELLTAAVERIYRA
jgi:hypothetical protein